MGKVRFNITIPAELREEMEGFDINWSDVAAEAFQQKLAEQTITRSAKPAVVKRLAESLRDLAGRLEKLS